MWDYQTNFGIVHTQNGTTTPDAELVKALGLKEAILRLLRGECRSAA